MATEDARLEYDTMVDGAITEAKKNDVISCIKVEDAIGRPMNNDKKRYINEALKKGIETAGQLLRGAYAIQADYERIEVAISELNRVACEAIPKGITSLQSIETSALYNVILDKENFAAFAKFYLGDLGVGRIKDIEYVEVNKINPKKPSKFEIRFTAEKTAAPQESAAMLK
ncbi:MAG: hypothetical protein FWE53_02600 [Firmicutes bacterium]|nr:hypothetical protein [Bacillota bacterium]